MPVRKIKKSYRSVTSVIASRKINRMVASESTLERDLFTLLEFDPLVETFEEQSMRVSYRNYEGKPATYTPDALCRLKTEPFDYLWQGSLFYDYFEYSEGLGKFRLKSLAPHWVLAEVKYRADLFDKWIELKSKFKAARAETQRGNGRFRILTEVELRTHVLDNVKLLCRFRHRIPQPEDAAKILQALATVDESTPNGILSRIAGSDRAETARLIPVLWYLVANFQIQIDWLKPPTMEIKLFAA